MRTTLGPRVFLSQLRNACFNPLIGWHTVARVIEPQLATNPAITANARQCSGDKVTTWPPTQPRLRPRSTHTSFSQPTHGSPAPIRALRYTEDPQEQRQVASL